jgi:hypothetical protein
MVLLKCGKYDGITVYILRTILKEMAAKIMLSQHFFFDLVQELSKVPMSYMICCFWGNYLNINLSFKQRTVGFVLDLRGRTIDQVVSCWLLIVAARVQSRVWSSGICGGQRGAGAGFLRVFRFPRQSSFHQLLHNHPHLSSGARTICQKWPQYMEISPTPLALKKNYIILTWTKL